MTDNEKKKGNPFIILLTGFGFAIVIVAFTIFLHVARSSGGGKPAGKGGVAAGADGKPVVFSDAREDVSPEKQDWYVNGDWAKKRPDLKPEIREVKCEGTTIKLRVLIPKGQPKDVINDNGDSPAASVSGKNGAAHSVKPPASE